MVDGRNRDLIAIEPRGLDNMVAHDGRVQIILEQLHHIDGIRACPPQECRGLKGARARAHGKLLRIEHDTGKKRLRLNRADVPLVDGVLQKLGHKFGGRRRERLMEVQNDLLNVICRSSVVVNDGHAGNGLSQCSATQPDRAGSYRRQ